MEHLADILPGAIQGAEAHRLPGREQSTASSRPTEKDFAIHPDRAKAEGYSYTQEPPPPEPCPHCGKLLYHYGAIMPGAQKTVITWFSTPEPCDCPAAQEERKREAAARRAREQEEVKEAEQERIRRRIAKLMADSGMGGRFQSRTFDRFTVTDKNRKAYAAAKRYADGFSMMLPGKDAQGRATPPAKERNGLFISGTKGTGKTHLAASIANQLIQAGVPVICMTMIDLLARVKETFDRAGAAGTEADILRVYKDVPLLIVDDIGTEQPTEWGLTKIYTIINARYESYMPTVITTNYSGDELAKRMTPQGDDGYTAAKTISRLQEMCAGIEMTWEDWRQH